MIVLASNSASRRTMLEAAGVAFIVKAADVDEGVLKQRLAGSEPAHIALELAAAKALEVSERELGELVLGGDSLVEVDGRLFDKPASRDEAAEHLRAFSGRTMRLTSGAVLARNGVALWRHAETAELRVRVLSDAVIARYLAHEWPAVKACVGVFRIEARGVQLFESIEGSHFTVLGMPLLAVLAALRDLGRDLGATE
ncbi:MAG TPA: Maf family protein [Novosphingobium sp.]|nr:Maf family protein [Novosphingobium sp.]